VLKQVVKLYAEQGWKPVVAPELEFYLIKPNLDPNELADEAFLRRIHNKIFVEPVSIQTFDQIFQRVATAKRVTLESDSGEYLRKLCLRNGRTELRACYPMDVLNIIQSIADYERRPPIMSKPELERATELYFAKSEDFTDID